MLPLGLVPPVGGPLLLPMCSTPSSDESSSSCWLTASELVGAMANKAKQGTPHTGTACSASWLAAGHYRVGVGDLSKAGTGETHLCILSIVILQQQITS